MRPIEPGDRVVNTFGQTGRVVVINGDQAIMHCEAEPVGTRYRVALVAKLVRA